MTNSRKDMFSRISQLSKNAPLQETSNSTNAFPLKNPDDSVNSPSTDSAMPKRRTKAVRRAKNVQIPEDLWDAYDVLKEKNVTSLLMTPYILEAFREKLARDGAFEK